MTVGVALRNSGDVNYVESMSNRSWVQWVVPTLTCVAVLAATGCSKDSEQVTAGTGSSSRDAVSASTADDPDEFCLAVTALDQTDGTTDPSVVLPIIEDLREAAPSEIQADVTLVSDTLIVNNYPSGTEPSMEAAPFDELDPARARLAAYVETNCQPGR